MRHDVVMRIAGLTDPKKSVGKDNASFEKLAIELKPYLSAISYNELIGKVKDLQDATNKIRDIRNKLLAHSDFYNAIEKEKFPIDG